MNSLSLIGIETSLLYIVFVAGTIRYQNPQVGFEYICSDAMIAFSLGYRLNVCQSTLRLRLYDKKWQYKNTFRIKVFITIDDSQPQLRVFPDT